MNKYLGQLIELQKLDIEIDSFKPKIKEARSELDSILSKHSNTLLKIESLEEEIKDVELKKRKNELHLEELSQKLKELSSKSNAVKSEKEIKALQLEEDIAKEQVDFANDEIERFEKLKEQKKSEIEELKKSYEDLKAELEKIEIQTNTKLEKIEEEKREVYDRKQKLLSSMTQNVIVFYEKIRRWAGNTTVIPVKKQACYGCYMRINDNTYAEVIKGEDITTCPHCGRILYMEHQEEKEEA